MTAPAEEPALRTPSRYSAQERAAVDRVWPDLHKSAADSHAGAEDLAGDHARGNAGGGLPGRGTAAAAIVANPVFFPVGVVGMPRAEAVGDVAVVLRALVGILDQQLDRRAGGEPVEHARQDAHEIILAPLRRKARLAALALVEPLLD